MTWKISCHFRIKFMNIKIRYGKIKKNIDRCFLATDRAWRNQPCVDLFVLFYRIFMIALGFKKKREGELKISNYYIKT
ncbi:hypothetical protein BpHYR1_008388 [Brachionus plicatilis]|uniref:Uncharacterized protein n=1 Tax=Brachionus plicatilis TaxID=10195 RepID=A0A3M7RCM5_BRAPC|nr:hypothetical protein BpHYR1_008388 [Brachionus plicatilis]